MENFLELSFSCKYEVPLKCSHISNEYPQLMFSTISGELTKNTRQLSPNVQATRMPIHTCVLFQKSIDQRHIEKYFLHLRFVFFFQKSSPCNMDLDSHGYNNLCVGQYCLLYSSNSLGTAEL